MTTTETEKVESQETKVEETLVQATEATNGDEKAPGEVPASPTKKTETLKPAITVHKKDFEKDVVYLYQFVRSATIPSLSADCLKVENWLRMLGIRYENVDHKLRFRSKKGQLPFVELNGKEIEDSDIIIKELSKYFDKDLDFGLTEDQKTTSHAFLSMLNNHTGWIVRCWRYNNSQEFLQTAQIDVKRTFNSRIPNSILNFVFKMGLKKHLRDSLGLGFARLKNDEFCDLAKDDLKALSNLLGSKDYFFGKEPHLLDCVAFAHIAQIVYVPFGGLKEWMEAETPNLLAFINRIKAANWPDWDEMCSTLELNTHLPKKEVPAEAAEAKADEESKKKKDEKKKKEKKDKKEKKAKDLIKDKLDEAKEEVVNKADEVVEKVTEVVTKVESKVESVISSVAPNGGEAPKPEVTASE